MINYVFDCKYSRRLDKLKPLDLFIVKDINEWYIYKVIRTPISSQLNVLNAEREGYIEKIDSIHPYYYNVFTDRNPTPNNFFEVAGATWYNFKTNECFRLLDYQINKKAVWEGDKGTLVCDDTTRILDIFNDGSALALYEFNDNYKDTGGLYDLEPHGNVPFKTGLVGKCVYFNGNSYLQGKHPKFNQNAGAVSFWVKPFKQIRSYGCMFHLSDSGRNTFSVWQRSNDYLYVIINDRYTKDFIKLKRGKWHHIVLNANSELYVNNQFIGKIADNVSASLTRVNQPMLVGADRDSATSINDWFKGQIEELRIFNKNLSQEEVNRLYNEIANQVNLGD